MDHIKVTICFVKFPVTSVETNNWSQSWIFAGAGVCEKVVVGAELEHQDRTVCLGQRWEELSFDTPMWFIMVCERTECVTSKPSSSYGQSVLPVV